MCRFADSARDLLERLLELRNVPPGPDHADERAGCLYNLLEFYRGTGRADMYLRYVLKLAAVHEQARHYTEAGFTLLHYATSILKVDWEGAAAVCGFGWFLFF